MKNNYHDILEDIIKKNSTSFYMAFRKLPEDKATAVYAVYAFCRLLDDAVDLGEGEKELDEIKKKFEASIAGEGQSEIIWKAFSHYFHKYNLKKDPFLMMFEGQSYDLDFKEFKNKQELDRYCDLVAGSVGLMLLPIMSGNGNEEKKTMFALDLGRAMQYTNILRDVGEDLERGRSYIPADLSATLGKKEIYKLLGDEALRLYSECQKNINLFNEDSTFPLILAIYYYRGILHKLFRNNFNNEGHRTYLNKIEKIIVLLKAKLYDIRMKKRA